MRGGDHDAAGGPLLADGVGKSGRGRDAVGEGDGDAGRREDRRDDLRKALGAEAGVKGDADASPRVFVIENVVGDRGGGDPDVGEGEVVGYDAAPAVGAEFHGRGSALSRVLHSLASGRVG